MALKPDIIRRLLLLISLALILRLAIAVFLIAAFPGDKFDSYVDTQGYLLLAKNLLQHHTFSGSVDPPFTPDTKRTPGFPLYLAGMQLLFGGHIPAFFFFNSLLSASTCGLIYLFLLKWFVPKTAFLAALLLALDPDSILCANYLITETLFTFLLLLAVYLLLASLNRNSLVRLLLSLLTFAAGIYVRPSGMTISILIILTVFAFQFKQNHFAWKKLLLSLITLTVLLLPWYMRNYAQTGRWEFSSAGKSRMIRYWTRTLLIPRNSRQPEALRNQFYRIMNSETRQWLEANPDFKLSADGMPVADIREYRFLELLEPQVSGMLRQNYVKVTANHIFSSLGTVFSSVLHGFNENMLRGKLEMDATIRGIIYNSLQGNFLTSWKIFFSYRHNYLQFIALLWILAHFSLAAAAVVFLLKDRQYFIVVFFGVIILYHIFISGEDALPRFRVPALPYLFGLSAFMIMRMWSKIRRCHYIIVK